MKSDPFFHNPFNTQTNLLSVHHFQTTKSTIRKWSPLLINISCASYETLLVLWKPSCPSILQSISLMGKSLRWTTRISHCWPTFPSNLFKLFYLGPFYHPLMNTWFLSCTLMIIARQSLSQNCSKLCKKINNLYQFGTSRSNHWLQTWIWLTTDSLS